MIAPSRCGGPDPSAHRAATSSIFFCGFGSKKVSKGRRLKEERGLTEGGLKERGLKMAYLLSTFPGMVGQDRALGALVETTASFCSLARE